MTISRFLQREPKEQRRIQTPGRKDDMAEEKTRERFLDRNN
jgi:hypothetical protein